MYLARTRNFSGLMRREFDLTRPTLSITSTESNGSTASIIPITFTFSERVTGFEVQDVTVTNGTKSNFVSVSDSVYTMDITPSPLATITVDVAEAVCTDLSGNSNTAASQFTLSSLWNGGVDDQYTVALLHMNGTNGATTFTDESGKSWNRTATAQIVTSEKKFGTGSIYLLRNNISNIYTSDHEDFNFAGGAFTIDCWIKMAAYISGGYQPLVTQFTNASNQWSLRLYTNTADQLTTLNFHSINAGAGVVDRWHALTTPMTVGNWHHIEFGRNGNTFYAFQNGDLLGTGTDADAIPNFSGSIYIGISTGTSGSCDVYMDEVRVSKGICRHTASFTIPSEEYHA